MASAQPSPYSANQLNSRCNPTASNVISTSASPIERHRMVRIGGDRIWESALTAASSMMVSPLTKSLREGSRCNRASARACRAASAQAHDERVALRRHRDGMGDHRDDGVAWNQIVHHDL